MGRDVMEKKRAFIINVLYYAIILFFAYLAIKFLVPVFLPFLLAFLVVWVLKYPTWYVARKTKLSKKWLLVGCLTLFYGLIVFGLIQLGSSVLPTMGNFIVQFPSIYRDDIVPALQTLSQNIGNIFQEANADVVIEMEEIFDRALQELGTFITDSSVASISKLSGVATVVPSFFIKFVIFVIASYFIACDYENVTNKTFHLLPEVWQKRVKMVADHTKNVIKVFLRSYLLLMVITFAELTIGLSILKIAYAPLIAFGIAVFDIFPILGTGGILIPWAVISVLIGNYRIAIGMFVLYLVITVIRNILEPRLVGKQIGLHPLLTLISMFIGARLFGVIGLFGFPVTLSILVQFKKNPSE